MTRAGSISQNNCQNRNSHSQPPNVSVFSKALFLHFSVHKLQIISELIACNSHLALKAAITSQYYFDYPVKMTHSRNSSYTDAKLGQG